MHNQYRHLSTACWTIDVHFKRLQSVQNAAARLVSGARRYDHITPVLTTLHWLPVRKRVMFKTVVLVWKCLNGTAPGYLRTLRSSYLCFRTSASQVSYYNFPEPEPRSAGGASLSRDHLCGTVLLLLYGDQR